MRLILHPKVYDDIDRIMAHYEHVATAELADEFYSELRLFMMRAAKSPHLFAVRSPDLRRVNLDRFPYHFLFRIVDETVRILVVRHHRRRPSFGMSRT